MKALQVGVDKLELDAQLSSSQMPRHRATTDPQTFQVSPWQQKRRHPGCDQPDYTQSRFSVGPKPAGLEQTPSSAANFNFSLPDQPDTDPTEDVIPPSSEEGLASFEAFLALMDTGDYQGKPASLYTINQQNNTASLLKQRGLTVAAGQARYLLQMVLPKPASSFISCKWAVSAPEIQIGSLCGVQSPVTSLRETNQSLCIGKAITHCRVMFTRQLYPTCQLNLPGPQIRRLQCRHPIHQAPAWNSSMILGSTASMMITQPRQQQRARCGRFCSTSMHAFPELW